MRADFKVFPSTEAVLMDARAGAFAGCISATANLNADLCARAWRDGEPDALAAAVSIRKLFDGKQLVPGVKALIAHIHDDAGLGAGAAAAERFFAVGRSRGFERLRQPAGRHRARAQDRRKSPGRLAPKQHFSANLAWLSADRRSCPHRPA